MCAMRFSIALSCSLFLLLLLFCTDRQIHLTFGFELLHTVNDTSTTYIIVAKSQRRVFFYLLVKLMWEFFCCFSHSCLSRKAKFTNADWQRRERVVTVFVCVCHSVSLVVLFLQLFVLSLVLAVLSSLSDQHVLLSVHLCLSAWPAPTVWHTHTLELDMLSLKWR